jgi:threonine/homoserine/homoserine lactone efflux protein
MISTGQILTFSITSFLIIMVPGPSVLFVIGRALAYGRRTALASAVGNDTGTFVLAAVVAFGLGSAVQRSVLTFTIIKLAGAAYLIFLGIRTLLQRRAQIDLEQSGGPRRAWRSSLDGFLVGVSNPKTVVFLAAMLPQFVNPSRGHQTVQMFILGVLFAVIALASDAGWSLLAGTVRTWFGRSPKRLELVGGAGGLTMIGLGIAVAVIGSGD